MKSDEPLAVNEGPNESAATASSSPIRSAALDYHARGWHPIRVHGLQSDGVSCTCSRRGATCRDAGKHPTDKAWQQGPPLTPEEIHNAWSGWRAGHNNVGLRTGQASGLFVLDVDSGGDESLAALGALPTTYTVRTGSGGRHYYFRMPEGEPLGNSAGRLGKGLDTRGEGGFVVAPPSVSARGAYSVEVDAPVAPAPAWLLDALTRRTPASASSAPLPDAYLRKAVGEELARLDAMREAATPDGRGYTGDPWDATTFQVACQLIELSNSTPETYPLDRAHADLLAHAPRDDGFGPEQHEAKWRSARARVGDKARVRGAAQGGIGGTGEPRSVGDAAPAPVGDAGPAPIPAKMGALVGVIRGKHKGVRGRIAWVDKDDADRLGVDPDDGEDRVFVNVKAVVVTQAAPADERGDDRVRGGAGKVIDYVRERYHLGVTGSGEAFAVPRQGARLPVMLGVSGGTLRSKVTHDLYSDTGSVPRAQTVDDAFRVIVAEASSASEATTLHLRVADLGERIVMDLGEQGSARCVVVEPGRWEVRENPPEGVLFRRTGATRPLPVPVRGGSLDGLREALTLDADDERWVLIRGWLVASVFASRPRPMLTFVGPPGSAKTTRARLTVSVLDPREELGSNFGKNLADDQTKALSRFLVSYDNLASVSEAVSDHLCRLVTGDEIDKRRLYTDAELATITYRRTGVMTAVTQPGLRPDALERVILLNLDRIDNGARLSEKALRARFDEAHPSVLGAVLDGVAGTLARLPDVVLDEAARMTDFHEVLAAYDERCAKAYVAAAGDVMADAAEADPFVAAVRAWLAYEGGGWHGRPSEAWAQATAHRRRQPSATAFDSQSQWWPRNGAAFVGALDKATEPLRAVGIHVKRGKTNGVRFVSLTTES